MKISIVFMVNKTVLTVFVSVNQVCAEKCAWEWLQF